MAVGGSEWVDAGVLARTARGTAAPRPVREAPATRPADRSRPDFGEILNDARGRDTTASRTRAARDAAPAPATDAPSAPQETGKADRQAATPRASDRADAAPTGSRSRTGAAPAGAAPGDRIDDPSRPASQETQPIAAADGVTSDAASAEVATARETAPGGDAAGKSDAKAAAEPPPAPDAPAPGQPAPAPPTLVALFAALAGGEAAAAAPRGTGTGTAEADAASLVTGAGRVTGAGMGNLQGGAAEATAAGPAVPNQSGPAVASQPVVEAANRADAPVIAEVGATKSRGESADAAIEPASLKPDFLAALADASRAAPDPGAATPTVTVPVAAHAASSAAPTGQTPAASTAPAAPPIPLGQVPMTIGLRSLQGSSEFQIRLDPAELGRIEVKLEIDKARGTVMTHLVVDRADTLQMLQRDAGQLQQALSQAGLDASGGVGLSLRGDGGGQDGSRQGGTGRQGGAWTAETDDAAPQAAPLRVLRGVGGLDIRI